MLKRFLFLLPLFALAACLEESSEKQDKKAFTRIYDNSDFNSSFYAIDMKPTADGGFLILGGKSELSPDDDHVHLPLGIYLLKLDELGNIQNEVEVENVIYPIGNLNYIDSRYYFFAMDEGYAANLVSVDMNGGDPSVMPVIPALQMPLASSAYVQTNDTTLLLLSYENATQESVISKVDLSGAAESERFSSGSPQSPVDDLVVSHVLRQGKQFPFFVGHLPNNKFYFNGFYDYTLSLVITSIPKIEAADPSLVQGQQDDAGLSAIVPLSQTRFALSTFNLGFSFFGPGRDIAPAKNNPESTTDIQAMSFAFPELKENTPVKIIRGVLDEQNVLIYASNTKSGQIGIYVYNEATGVFVSSKYLGYTNPFEVAAIVQTPEGDLAISGTTYIAGRLPRLCLIKVPEDEIKD